jgi:hypothetical protein
MGVAIYRSNQVWGGHDRGIQLLGECHEAEGAVQRKAESIYGARFQKYENWKKGFAKQKRKFDLRFYRFVPKVAIFLDESQEEYVNALVVVDMK